MLRIIRNLLLFAVAAALLLGLVVAGPWLWLLVHSLAGRGYGVAFIVASLLFAGAIIRVVMRAWRRKPQSNSEGAQVAETPAELVSTEGPPDLDASFRTWLAGRGLDRSDLPPFEMSQLRREFNAHAGLV